MKLSNTLRNSLRNQKGLAEWIEREAEDFKRLLAERDQQRDHRPKIQNAIERAFIASADLYNALADIRLLTPFHCAGDLGSPEIDAMRKKKLDQIDEENNRRIFIEAMNLWNAQYMIHGIRQKLWELRQFEQSKTGRKTKYMESHTEVILHDRMSRYGVDTNTINAVLDDVFNFANAERPSERTIRTFRRWQEAWEKASEARRTERQKRLTNSG